MVDMNELNNAKNKMKRVISMYKQTLKNLRDFLTNTTSVSSVKSSTRICLLYTSDAADEL